MPPLALLPNRPAGSPDITSWGYGGGMSPTTTALGNTNPNGMTYDQLKDLLARQFAANKAEADRQYKLQKGQLDQQWNIARMNAKSQKERNEIDRWYNQQQVAIARDRLAEDSRQFNERINLDRGKLGYDLLAQAAQLRGPRNYVQAANYMRGVANNPNTPSIFSALQNNASLPDFGQQAGLGQAVSLQSLLGDMGQGGGAGGQQQNALTLTGGGQQGQTQGQMNLTGGAAPSSTSGLVNQAHTIYQNAHKIQAGGLEGLNNAELGLLESGIEAPDEQGNAGDWSMFLDAYKRSRIGDQLQNRRMA